MLLNKHKQKEFEIEVKNHFSSLASLGESEQRTHTTAQQRYDSLTAAIEKASENVLGKKKRRKTPEWVSAETIDIQEECDLARAKFRRRKSKASHKIWRELAEKVRQSYAQDEKNFMECQLKELESAARNNQMGRTWEIINKLSGKDQRAVIKVKKLDGSAPKSEADLLEDWGAYFSKLLNNEQIGDPNNLPAPATKDLDISTKKFSSNEVNEAIELLQTKKLPGIDSCIVAEVLKYGGEFIREEIKNICNDVFEHREAPKQWKSNLIVPVPKKGNLQLMTNYRGISLMSIAAKVYNKIIFNRLIPVVDKILRRNQAGFRKGRSCIQQIHILRRIIEGATARGIPFFITFIDFKKAFDSICRKTMFAILRHIGIPDQIVQAIKVLYDDSNSKVFVDGQYSKEFKVTTGVLQGDVLAPSLFIIVIDFVMRQSEKDFGIITHPRKSSRHPVKRLNDLDYADDIALLETSLERANEQLKTTSDNTKKDGLKINVEKTKIMIMNTYDVQNALRLNEDCSDYVEQVRDFKYLRSMMASSETDLKNRKVYPIEVKSSHFSGSVHLNFTVRERNVDPVRENEKVAR